MPLPLEQERIDADPDEQRRESRAGVDAGRQDPGAIHETPDNPPSARRLGWPGQNRIVSHARQRFRHLGLPARPVRTLPVPPVSPEPQTAFRQDIQTIDR